MGQTTSLSYKFRRINPELCKAIFLADGLMSYRQSKPVRPFAPEWYKVAAHRAKMPQNKVAMVLMTDISIVYVQGWNVKMTSIVETTQVVAVLALLPFVLVGLLIMEPFDRIRLRVPKRPKARVARQEPHQPRRTLESELA